MKSRNFLFCTAITALCYLTMSVLYYSQIYSMYDLFSERFIYMTVDGWANLAQAAGIAAAMLLIRRRPKVFGSRFAAAGVLAGMFPTLCLSVLAPSPALLFAMMLTLNVLIGYTTVFYFSLIARYTEPQSMCFSFAAAYAVGSFATWLVSLVGEDVLTSARVLPLDLVLLTLSAATVLLYQNLCPDDTPDESFRGDDTRVFWRENRLLLAVIALMSAVSMLGSADSTAITPDIGINIVSSRALYGLGLLFAAFVYTKSRSAGAVLTMASLVWPFLAIVLFHESLLIVPACLLSYILLGFFAVYRTGSFLDPVQEKRLCPALAAAGLLVSRLADTATTFVLTAFYDDIFLVSLVAAGLLFIPLLILFFYMFTQQLRSLPAEAPAPVLSESERRAAFAERYGLTRREEEIAFHLSQSHSNGEIAALLSLSENTVRFHVSNILKKTGLHDRNEVSRAYNAPTKD